MNRLEKKTTATLLIALFLISAFAVAMPISAYTGNEYKAAVLSAGDRLVGTQNDDGSFDWQLTQGHGYDNAQGITAMGILKAHELEDKETYEIALAKSYGYMMTPDHIYYAYPDITYLVWLADAAEADASLLTKINNVVSGTSVQDIRDRAETVWVTRLAEGRYGTGNPDEAHFTATQLAEYELDRRGSLGFWDLEAAVKAALALGLDADAHAIADVMHTHLTAIPSTTDVYYTLALSGAIEAFSELGVYPDMARTLKNLLLGCQDGIGYWDQGGDVTSDKESVQTTAYAIMALLAQDDENAILAASKGGDWLISTQDVTGGWYPGYVGSEYENLEVDSEAAWALSVVYQEITESGSVTMTADVRPPIISINVDLTEIDFGTLIRGHTSETVGIKVTNIGEAKVTITAEMFNQNMEAQIPGDFYYDYLFVGSPSPGTHYPAQGYTTSLQVGQYGAMTLYLDVPQDAEIGTYEGILVFWAEEYTG